MGLAQELLNLGHGKPPRTATGEVGPSVVAITLIDEWHPNG
jgi:hypothetical protein